MQSSFLGEEKMTVNTEKSYQKYVGNGVTTLFNIPFEFLDDEIVVFKGGTLEAYVKDVDYHIEGQDIVFNIAPAEEQSLYIARKVILKQLVDFINGDNFPAENYEYSLDHITYALQELSMWVNQAWKSPLGTTPEEGMDKLIRSYVGENVTERFKSIDDQIERLFTLVGQITGKFAEYYNKPETDEKIQEAVNTSATSIKQEFNTKIDDINAKIGDIDAALDVINGEVI